ncbi:MAG: right-handed parallel beta-helix repeat-containing protein, partial [Candidatus Omnitrophica bacterium]|nr:right-handed parallel beta-helix repeat-containing protein [Candidatus Omnitrophota bacterium]
MKLRSVISGGLLSLALIFSITGPCLAEDPVTAAGWVEQGKQNLINNGNLSGAHSDFQQALILEPNHPQANFWRAITLVSMTIQDQGVVDTLNAFGITNNPAEGDPRPLVPGDLNDIMALGESVSLPESGLDDNSPTLTDVQTLLDSVLLPNIISALNDHIQKISDNTEYSDTITIDEETLTIGYAEVKALEAGLNALAGFINLLCAYNTDNFDIDSFYNSVDSGSTPAINDILNNYPNILTLKDAERLTDAKGYMQSAVEGGLTVIDLLNTRGDDGEYFLGLDPEDQDTTQIVTDNLEALQQSLDEGISFDLSAPADTFPQMDDFYSNVAFNFSSLFDSPKNIRALLPEFDANNEILKSSFPDPTMAGLFPDMTQEDLNHFIGVGPEYNQISVDWNSSPAPQIILSWEMDESADFNSYRIARTTTPDDNSSWQWICDPITDASITTLQDADIDEEANNIYYYRLYAYYNSGAESTYSNTGVAILAMYIDIDSISSEEDGTKDNPFKSISGVINDFELRGAKLRVAQGEYNESTRTGLWFDSESSVILEGGYESANWTRDVNAYMTNINAAGLEGSVISIPSNSTIDGFIITGALNDQGFPGTGIDIYQRSSVTIKNCMVISNQIGIAVSDSSGVSIEHCIIGDNSQCGLNVYNTQNMSITDSFIVGNINTGINCGGASSDVSLYNNVIAKNTGTGVNAVSISKLTIVNNTVAHNDSDGPVVFANGIYYSGIADLTIANNTVFANNNYGILGDGTAGTITANNSYGNGDGNFTNCGTAEGSDDNTCQDPLFLDPDNVAGDDNTPWTSDDGYMLTSNSPCIDKGGDSLPESITEDIIGNNRISGNSVDMGAYEYQQEDDDYEPILTADIDGNGIKDLVMDFGQDSSSAKTGLWVRYNNSASWKHIALDSVYEMLAS